MGWLNSNLIHNILNVAIGIQAALIAGLITTGCVSTAAGGLDCSASWINPKVVGILIVVSAGLKIAINIGRDGISGLFKPQPPVVK